MSRETLDSIVGVGAPIKPHGDDKEWVAERIANFGLQEDHDEGEFDDDFAKACEEEMYAPKLNGHDQMQVLVALYDDDEPGPAGVDNSMPIYVPHVQRCEFCPTNKENVLASFDHLHKCEVDKHVKNGFLTHKAGPIADEG